MDIYNSDPKPTILPGKTFTLKASLREVCRAVRNYSIVALLYPIVISAEVHCGAGLDQGDHGCGVWGGTGEGTNAWAADTRDTTKPRVSEGADIVQGVFFVMNIRKKLLTWLLPDKEYI